MRQAEAKALGDGTLAKPAVRVPVAESDPWRSPIHSSVQECDVPSLCRVSRSLVDVGAPPYTRCMTPELAGYIEAGKALNADERLEAAHQLLLSVDQDAGVDQADIDAEWDEVVDRRVEEIVSGKTKLVEGRDAHARVRAEVAALRK